MRPMLAFRWADRKYRVTYPCYVQPKLDGVRALYHAGNFQSRDEHLWNPPVVSHLVNRLYDLPPNIVLDGEMYLHTASRQEINGAISVNRIEPNSKTHLIQYHVFDLLNLDFPTDTFILRNTMLSSLPIWCQEIQRVETVLINTPYEAEHHYLRYKQLHYEGAMYRCPTAPYGLSASCSNKENRWEYILKRKGFQDKWFPVIGFERGTGKYVDMVGALVLELEDGRTFSVGSGITDSERVSFLYDLPEEAHVRYDITSDTGIPIQPTIEETR